MEPAGADDRHHGGGACQKELVALGRREVVTDEARA